MNVGIYGLGNFGYALLKHLDKNNGARFTLHGFDRNPAITELLHTEKRHPHLFPTTSISDSVVVYHSARNLIERCDIVILAVNSDATREVARQIAAHTRTSVIIVNTAKAIDYKTGTLLSALLASELKARLKEYAVLSGGTIAADVLKHDPLGVSLACSNPATRRRLVKLFQSNELFVYPSADVFGVEAASAMKNIIAILAGITKGLGFSLGSETHLISRAANEAERLIKRHFGGKDSTFRLRSQCWGNDLWMSALGDTRNRTFGIMAGSLQSFEAASRQAVRDGMTVEGLNTLKALRFLPGLSQYPLLFTFYQLSRNAISFAEFKSNLFTQNI